MKTLKKKKFLITLGILTLFYSIFCLTKSLIFMHFILFVKIIFMKSIIQIL